MQIVDAHYCFGPNIYTDKTAFWCHLDLEKLGGFNTDRLGCEFRHALFILLPGLQSHVLEYGQQFTHALEHAGGIHAGRLVERIAVEMQRLAGHDVSWGTTLQMAAPSQCRVVVECNDQAIFALVLRQSLFLLNSLLPSDLREEVRLPPRFSPARHLQLALRAIRAAGLDITGKAIVEKAIARKIPWQRLHPAFHFVQLGQGCHAKQVATSTNSLDNPIRLDNNKSVTVYLLEQIGLPVPKQAVVRTEREAVEMARAIGYPVVIKPLEGMKGAGITTGIMSDGGVAKAAETAFRYGGNIVVEQHIRGYDHRLLVVNGKLVAAAKRIPAHVIGDSKRSIRQLVQEVNRDPRRGKGSENILVQLELDDKALTILKDAGYTPDSVPAKGQVVLLSDTANISTGGTAVDVTDQVHPDKRAMAETAVRFLGLAVGGLDFITPDISRSWGEVPGYIIEVNHGPGLRPHWIADPSRDVVGPILDMLIPGDHCGRIPIAAITGSNGKTTTSQMLAHILQASGRKCGLATTQGVFIEGRQIIRGDLAGTGGAHRIFLHQQVEVAVVESSRGGLLRSGLAFDSCDVGCVLNVTQEHVGDDGIKSIEELARIKRLVAERAGKALVLNAEDEWSRAMAAHSPADHLCLVAVDKGNSHLQAHISQGGHAAFLDTIDGRRHICLSEGGRLLPVVATADIPASYNEMAFCNVINAMFAAAIAWEMRVTPAVIGAGLRTFESTFTTNPGRLTIYDRLPFRVILDNAHNPAKYRAMADFIGNLPAEGRRIILISPSGRKTDEDLREIAGICVEVFDHFFLARRDNPKDKRGKSEVQELISEALQGLGVSRDCITVCDIETEATAQALAFARPKDLLVLAVFDQISCWNLMTSFAV